MLLVNTHNSSVSCLAIVKLYNFKELAFLVPQSWFILKTFLEYVFRLKLSSGLLCCTYLETSASVSRFHPLMTTQFLFYFLKYLCNYTFMQRFTQGVSYTMQIQ